MTPETLERALEETPERRGGTVVSPTYFRRRGRHRRPRRGGAHGAACRSSSTRPGAHLAFHPDLPAHALALGADLVISSIHKIVGSLTQSAMMHLGHGELIEESVVDRCVTLIESTSPNALLSASLDTARRSGGGERRGHARRDAARPCAASVRPCARCPASRSWTSASPEHPGVFDYDPLRLAIDVRGTPPSGYELARLVREQDDVHLELAGENVMVAVFGMGEAVAAAERCGGAPPGRSTPSRAEERAAARRSSRRRRPGASW